MKKKVGIRKKKPFPKWHASPLKGSFMVSSLLGILISAYYVLPRSKSLGIAFLVIFASMVMASFISMTKAPVPPDWGVKA